jgi:hypothetical protein
MVRRPLVLALLTLLSLLAGACSSAPKAPPEHAHSFAFLRTGPRRAEYSGEPLQTLMKGHMDNIGRLAESEELLLAGPFAQGNPDPTLRGVFLFATPDAAAGAKLCESDPSIAAGVFAVEVVPLRTRKDLPAALHRHQQFEERRKADPSIPMMEGMSTYVLVLASDAERAGPALEPLRAAGQVVLEARLGGTRDGELLVVLDQRDLAGGEAALEPVKAALGDYKAYPWFGSAFLRD